MLTYKKGDACYPDVTDEGIVILMHCCNDLGGQVWGAGFTHALDKRWPAVGNEYRAAAATKRGTVQFIDTGDDIIVANIIGQRGVRSLDNPCPVDYEALLAGFKKVVRQARHIVKSCACIVTIACPRLGAGLAGGKWEEVEKLINSEIVDSGFDVTVYDL